MRYQESHMDASFRRRDLGNYILKPTWENSCMIHVGKVKSNVWHLQGILGHTPGLRIALNVDYIPTKTRLLCGCCSARQNLFMQIATDFKQMMQTESHDTLYWNKIFYALPIHSWQNILTPTCDYSKCKHRILVWATYYNLWLIVQQSL